MAISYTWKVTGVKSQSNGVVTDAIVQTYWEKIGVDEFGNEGKFSGATPFSLETLSLDNFVPFSQLTEAIVLDWIKSVVTGSYQEHVDGQILKQIELKKAPVSEKNMPWAPPPEASPAATPAN